jgi:CBS domain-containing protein
MALGVERQRELAGANAPAHLDWRRISRSGGRLWLGLNCGSACAKGGIMQIREILRIKGKLLITIAPDGMVSDGVSIMSEKDIGSLVVMNQGSMVGMLTFREVLQALHKNKGSIQGVRVDAIMVRNPRTISPNVEVDELRSVMLEHHIRYMPVTDGETLVGVLSFHDVARAVLEEQAFENRMLKGYIKDSPT